MLQEEKYMMFRNRLQKVNKHLSKIAKAKNLSCYRIYDHDLPEFPFIIEKYESCIYVAEYVRKHGLSEDEYNNWLEKSIETIGIVTNTPVEAIYIRQRKRIYDRSDQYKRSITQKKELIAQENGLKFIVNLTDYLDTGLFLDHRVTRELVRKDAVGKKVLNLFSYTGSFSVYAAAGGASEVATIDLSNTYIRWAKENMQLNGFIDEHKYSYITADVISYLQTIPQNSFDVIILDPPTFSNSKKTSSVLDIQRDHTSLINKCMDALTNNGVIYFSTNYKKFVLENNKIITNKIKDITKATTPFDFEGKLKRQCFKIQK